MKISTFFPFFVSNHLNNKKKNLFRIYHVNIQLLIMYHDLKKYIKINKNCGLYLNKKKKK